MNKEKIVIFDIDYTLFDSKNYRDNLVRKIGEEIKYKDLKAFEKIGEDVYMELRKSVIYFDPKLYAKSLSNYLNIDLDENLIEAISLSEKIIDQSVYEEALEAIEALKNKNFKIGIFSTGLETIQRAKISKFEKHLEEEHIHIIKDKKEFLPKLIEKYKNHDLYMVDDLLEILYSAVIMDKSVHTIWIKRGRFAKESDTKLFTPDVTVSNLTEAVEFIKNS